VSSTIYSLSYGRPAGRAGPAIGWFAVLLATAAWGATIEGVRFVDSCNVDGTRLTLVGTGLQRHAIIYKVCVAGFYLPPGTPAGNAFTDVPKRLEIEYFHAIKAAQFAALTTKGVRSNASESGFDQVAARLQRLNAAYRNVKPGDRYSLTYLPGRGSTLALNGRDLVTIRGADFAKALYAVWLGEKPVTEGLRAGLLGND